MSHGFISDTGNIQLMDNREMYGIRGKLRSCRSPLLPGLFLLLDLLQDLAKTLPSTTSCRQVLQPLLLHILPGKDSSESVLSQDTVCGVCSAVLGFQQRPEILHLCQSFAEGDL